MVKQIVANRQDRSIDCLLRSIQADTAAQRARVGAPGHHGVVVATIDYLLARGFINTDKTASKVKDAHPVALVIGGLDPCFNCERAEAAHDIRRQRDKGALGKRASNARAGEYSHVPADFPGYLIIILCHISIAVQGAISTPYRVYDSGAINWGLKTVPVLERGLLRCKRAHADAQSKGSG